MSKWETFCTNGKKEPKDYLLRIMNVWWHHKGTDHHLIYSGSEMTTISREWYATETWVSEKHSVRTTGKHKNTIYYALWLYGGIIKSPSSNVLIANMKTWSRRVKDNIVVERSAGRLHFRLLKWNLQGRLSNIVFWDWECLLQYNSYLCGVHCESIYYPISTLLLTSIVAPV